MLLVLLPLMYLMAWWHDHTRLLAGRCGDTIAPSHHALRMQCAQPGLQTSLQVTGRGRHGVVKLSIALKCCHGLCRSAWST